MKNYLLRCKINGEKFEGLIDPNMRLIDFLREEVGLKGTKEGCGEGECGACMVLLDGKAVNSCLVMAFSVSGKEIITIEGIDKTKYGKKLKKSFKKNAAVQCGFCTPGFIITAAAFLEEKPNATEEEIKEALSGNICRCTGYDMIIKAVDEAKK
ncbi:MAG: (2Fe-2S)-binding protein [Elusimicrobiales bacterium]|nr:(2Fe-2S)-binding protein [Elusimicrobiales bacterium]